MRRLADEIIVQLNQVMVSGAENMIRLLGAIQKLSEMRAEIERAEEQRKEGENGAGNHKANHTA